MTQPFTISGSYQEYRNGITASYSVRFQRNDAGRSTSRRPKQENDCTVRAYALAFDIPYDEAYELLRQAGRECRKGFDFRAFANEHPRLKWRAFQAVKGESRMNPAKFCTQFPTGRWIARTAKHVFAVIDGVIFDTTSPRPDRCIYGAWEVLER